jgi:RNA polymerase sigma-70 factor (ECF subfamily)
MLHTRGVMARSSDPADEQLMLETGSGSRASFERLFARYRDPLWRFFRRRVADEAAAEELAQDTFLAVFEAAPRYRASAAFRSYLFGVAYNVLFAYRRRSARDAADVLEEDAVPGAAVAPDTAIWVRRALAQLDADDREVLMLREYEGLSYQEIADALGLPVNTVRSRLFRARTELRTVLDPGGAPQDVHR